MTSKKLTKSFFKSIDVVSLAQSLLGKVIVTDFGCKTAGIIVETESYKAPEDKASHAYNLKRTPRTETMYQEYGVIYIYLCYGIHHLLNIVTGPKDTPHAILIRAIEPLEGIDTMCQRRRLEKPKRNLTAGPGLVTQALGLTIKHDSMSLNKPPIWLEDRNISITQEQIIASPRVGVDYAQEYANLPWRFRVKDNPWTSPAK